MELERDLMTKEEVLYRLGDISEDTFYRLCCGGSLERVYPRRNIMRITRESYLAYLETVKQQTTQPLKGAAYGPGKSKSTGQRSSARAGQASPLTEQATPAPSLGSKVRSLFGFKGAGTHE